MQKKNLSTIMNLYDYVLDKDGKVRRKSIDDLQDLDPVTLAELGTRRGSRFSADGTPLFLRWHSERLLTRI